MISTLTPFLVLLIILFPIDASVVEQQELEPREGRRLRRDSYIEAVESGNTIDTDLFGESPKQDNTIDTDLFGERPKQDAVKCCVCSAITESSGEKYGKCASETLKVKRNKLKMKVEGETCESICTMFGRSKESKIESACPKTAPPPCSIVPAPAKTQTCCHCSSDTNSNDGAASASCVVPSRKVYRNKVGIKIGGNTCENACGAFGRAEWEKKGSKTSHDGYCNDEEYEKLCAAAEPIATDVIPLISSSILPGGKDGFDVLRWINTHFISIAVDPDVVRALEHTRVEVDSPRHAESARLHSTTELQQSFEDRISFFYSTMKNLESSVIYALKFGATFARLQHHVRTAMILAHVSGAMSSFVSLVFMPLQITLHLFVYTILPWNHNKESTMALLHFSSRVVATTSCAQHRLRSFRVRKLSNTMEKCSDETKESVLRLIDKSKNAAIDLLSNILHVAACFGLDVNSFSRRQCFEKIQNSLMDSPAGLFSEIALRLQVYTSLLHVLLERDTDGHSEASGLSATMRSVFGVFKEEVHRRFSSELENALDPKVVEDIDTVCSAAAITLSFHTKLFEAFSRTLRMYMSGRAGKRWRFPSVEWMGMDGTFMEGLTIIRPCRDVFDVDGDNFGRCKSVPKHYDFADSEDKACSQAMSKGGPLWYEETK